jgi:ABC-type antimicrobial peptide transport system permease subunit
MGIRMALGASRSDIISLVLRGAMWQLLLGVALGIPAAFYAGHLITSLLYGVKGSDPVAYVGAAIALAMCAAIAGFVPARRAASIEPMHALRSE